MTAALGKTIEALQVHGNSIQPVFDERQNGTNNGNQFDCRTLAAQGQMLENWIDQQTHLGNSVIILGDFIRRLNAFDNDPNRDKYFWISSATTAF